MNKGASRFEEGLHDWLRGAARVVVAGIGNPIRRDDQAGIAVVQGMQGMASGTVHLIECETVPESFVDEIIGIMPSHVLLIDAAVLGRAPGAVGIFAPEEVMDVATISSHALPLRVFCDYVRAMTGARIALLLIEPKSTEFGEGMTSEIEKAVARAKAALLAALP